MRVLVNCPRQVFSGDRNDQCGCAIEVEVSIPPRALVKAADSVEIPVECFYHHRFDQEEVGLLRDQINWKVDQMENAGPMEVPDFVDPFEVDGTV